MTGRSRAPSPQVKRWRTLATVRKATGWRSLTEQAVAAAWSRLSPGTDACACYETGSVPYEVRRTARYTPDFLCPELAMAIEVKRRFPEEDREKMLAVKRAYPDLDLRLVFDRPNSPLRRGGKTTCADWARKNGFPCCGVREFPPADWVEHTPEQPQRAVFDMLFPKVLRHDGKK
ncbi:endonuclease [Desulfovibrio piger]|nr:endonuclease [Desulfovibrio piger]